MFNRSIIRRLLSELRTLRLHSNSNVGSARSWSSMCERENTIYALSSGYGKCGVAVIRLSGSKTVEVISKMTGQENLPTPRQAVLRTIIDHVTGNRLDRALILWFPAPNSFTGEDVCEFHVHGGSAVIASVFRSLSTIPGLRHAEPGEYTKRAFLNGKLDLTEVEGLGDLIHAETEEQRKQAFKQMEGRLKVVIGSWRKDLIRCLAHVEAYIDFGEDQHIEDAVLDEVSSKLEVLSGEIKHHLNDKRRGERLRSGVKLAIIGEPNVGKSSLLNLITARPAAIVSPIAGTTRDVIETTLDVDGFPVIISDTAGLRDSNDMIEIEGVRRAKVKASEADLVLYVIDASEICEKPVKHLEKIFTEETPSEFNANFDQIRIFVINKCDLLDKQQTEKLQNVSKTLTSPTLLMSCETQSGFESLLNVVAREVKLLCSGENPSVYSPSLTQERHRTHVVNCFDDINNSIATMHKDVVIAAEYLRLAANQLGKITGKIGAEEVLDVIFKDFCIGK